MNINYLNKKMQMTQTFQQPVENPYDTENSLLAYSIYHQWRVSKIEDKNVLKYYLKKKKDKEWDLAPNDDERLRIELVRSVRFINNKVNGRYGDNKITSIQVYFNDNKGGTVPETQPNALLCQLDVLRNGTYELRPNREIVPEENIQFLLDIMEGWKEAIQKVRR